ncbi:MAG: hypothetical protein J6B60_04905 [Clostridia bacterium]|nr:hypothetical protein [Clostridia bacterium]
MYSKLHDVLNDKENNFMLPFYWQHGDHYDTIPLEIERIYNSGCRAFCVESRPHKDFVGDTWWRDMDLIINEAKKRDMQVWVLDDDHFPTGNAAGHIKNYYPEKRRWDIGERHVDVLGPQKRSLLLTNENENRQLLGVYAYKRTGNLENCSSAEILDFSNRIKNGFCEITIPEGLWRVFFIYKTRELNQNEYYIDMLSRDSVRVLINAVYEPHYKHYKEHFGNTFRGFFSDEPAFGNSWFSDHAVDRGLYERRLGLAGMAYPWSSEVFQIMHKSLGFDPLPYIAAIWFDIGDKTSEIRYAYMDTITKLYRDNFTRQLGDWCKERGVEYIGHIIEDMNNHKRTGYGAGHYFRALDGQHMSGIDIVLHQLLPGMSDYIHTASAFGNNADPEFFDYTLAKLGASLAHIGKDMKGKAMCEVFGAYGWAESCSDMKWLLDHLLVRGINHFVPHAFSPSFPDPDCPPHFGAGDCDPQYEGFSRLMKYGNKVAHLLYGGCHIANAAILYDAEFEWMNKENTTQFMQVPAKILYDNNIDFDFLPIDCIIGAEDARIYSAEAENGKLKVGNQRYNVLIIPEAPITPQRLTESLNRLSKMGVKIIRLGIDCTKDGLYQKITSLFTPDIEAVGSKKFLRSCHYVDGANDIYMFANENMTCRADCEITLNGVKSDKGVCLDLLNDIIYKVELENKKMKLSLAPNQSSIYIFGDVDFNTLPEKKCWGKYEKAQLTFKIESANANDLKDFTLLKDNVKASELFSITSIDNIPNFSGKLRYSAKFDSSSLPSKKNIAIDLIDVGNSCRLFLNGEDLGIRVTKPYFYDLSNKIIDGENELIIEVSNTLANNVRDYLSSYMAIRAAGLTEQPCFVTP